jgi:hypothetical protein
VFPALRGGSCILPSQCADHLDRCERCRKGKKKCNRLLPCHTCESNGVECVYPVTEKKRLVVILRFLVPCGWVRWRLTGPRPVPKEYVNALELDLAARSVKIEALEKQVQDLSGQVDALRGLVSWWEGESH